ncbi:MAG: carboxypeptidase-like regulatory domain-containing protein [Planctomycetota bacterium]
MKPRTILVEVGLLILATFVLIFLPGIFGARGERWGEEPIAPASGSSAAPSPVLAPTPAPEANSSERRPHKERAYETVELRLKPDYDCAFDTEPEVTLSSVKGVFAQKRSFKGTVAWKNLVPGEYFLSVQGEGWKSARHGVEISGAFPVQELVWTPAPYRKISGRVFAAAGGRPVPAFRIWVDFRVPQTRGILQRFLVSPLFRNPDGRFCIEGGVPEAASELRLRVEAEGFAPYASSWISNRPSSSTTDLLLSLLDDQKGRAWVAGEVVEENGAPVEGAWCMLLPPGEQLPWLEKDEVRINFLSSGEEERRLAKQETGPDGGFRLGVLDPGDYRLVFLKEGFVPAGLDLPDLRLGLQSGPHRVRLERGGTLTISVLPPPPTDPPVHFDRVNLYGPLKKSATFRGGIAKVAGLPAGTWKVLLRGWQGKGEAPESGLLPPLDSRTVSLKVGEHKEVVFDLGGAELGSMVRGRFLGPPQWPTGRTFVLIIPGGKNPSVWKTGGVDETGAFVLRGIPDGDFQIAAYSFSEDRSRFALAAAALKVPEQTGVFLTLDAMRPLVRGRLLREGKPAHRKLDLGLSPDTGDDLMDAIVAGAISLQTNDRGGFEIAGLPAGHYVLHPFMEATPLGSFDLRETTAFIELDFEVKGH